MLPMDTTDRMMCRHRRYMETSSPRSDGSTLCRQVCIDCLTPFAQYIRPARPSHQ